MNIGGWGCLLCLGLLSTAVRAEDPAALFSRGDSFSYSAANPITAYLNLLIGPAPQHGSVFLSRNNIEFGFSLRRFEFSLIHRNDYNLIFHPETADFAYRNQNKVDIPIDQFYQVDVWANQYQLTGAKFGYELPLSQAFSLVFAYSHLYASESVYGYMGKNAEGEGGVIRFVLTQQGGQTVKTLDGELYADYYYTDDPLFQRDVKGPSGSGYAIDIGFNWQALPNLVVEGRVLDASGRIKWKDLPHTIASANTDTITIDESGFLAARPRFQGVETFDDLNQKLARRDSLSARYRFKNWYAAYQYDRMTGVSFNRLMGGYFWSDRWGLTASVEALTSALGLALHMPAGRLHITFDELDLDNAHTLGLGWDIHYRF